MLLLNTNSIQFMGSPTARSHLTYSDLSLKGENQGHLDFEVLFLIKDLSWATSY